MFFVPRKNFFATLKNGNKVWSYCIPEFSMDHRAQKQWEQEVKARLHGARGLTQRPAEALLKDAERYQKASSDKS